MAKPTLELVQRLIKYDDETGVFYWLPRTPEDFRSDNPGLYEKSVSWNAHFAGKQAFTSDHKGYRRGSIGGMRVFAHQLAWLLSHGEWPSSEIDHINGNRADNRIANLRLVDHQENSKNACISTMNTTGVMGVTRARDRWKAEITLKGKRFYLGCFKEKGDAIAARLASERELGFHENHGKR